MMTSISHVSNLVVTNCMKHFWYLYCCNEKKCHKLILIINIIKLHHLECQAWSCTWLNKGITKKNIRYKTSLKYENLKDKCHCIIQYEQHMMMLIKMLCLKFFQCVYVNLINVLESSLREWDICATSTILPIAIHARNRKSDCKCNILLSNTYTDYKKKKGWTVVATSAIMGLESSGSEQILW